MAMGGKMSYGMGGKMSYGMGGKMEYGLGGALLKVGSNLAQGKGFGSGALQGVGKAAITPGSGIGAGAELAGNLLQKSDNPALKGIGKGLDIASNFAPGGGGVMGAIGDAVGGAGGAGGAGGGGGIGGALAGLAGGGGAGGAGGGLLNMASQFLGERGMKVKLMKKGGVVYAEGGLDLPEGEEMEVSITPQSKRPLDNVLFGEREELTDREGKKVGEVFEPSKLRKLFGGPDVKASFEDGGSVYAEGGIKLMKRSMEEGGETDDPPRADFLMSGDSSEPEESKFIRGTEILGGDPLEGELMATRLGSETTQSVAGLPSFGYGELYSEEGKGSGEAPDPESPEDLAPISSRGPRVIRSGSDKMLAGGKDRKVIKDPETGQEFFWSPTKGQFSVLQPGTGRVSEGKGGEKKEILFTPESMAKFMFDQKAKTGKVKVTGRTAAGLPITETQMLYPTYDDALREAQKRYSAQKKRLGDVKEYDLAEFIKMAKRPSNVVSPR